MALPDLTDEGDLPPGVYSATWKEVIARFGSGTIRRQKATEQLEYLLQLARATGKVTRALLFGSYVTEKLEPNDVDVFLVMAADFTIDDYSEPTRSIFSHSLAQRVFGASVFWARQGMNPQIMDDLIEGWQTRRDRSRRGIVEIVE